MNWKLLLQGLSFIALLHSVAFGGIQVRAFWGYIPDDPLSHGEIIKTGCRANIFMQIRNAGSAEVTVFCGESGLILKPRDVVGDTFGARLLYSVSEQPAIGAGISIPSLTDLRPVKLRSNEVVQLEMYVDLRPGINLKNVELRYKVAEQIGKRFDGWYGELDCKPIYQTVQNIRDKKAGWGDEK